MKLRVMLPWALCVIAWPASAEEPSPAAEGAAQAKPAEGAAQAKPAEGAGPAKSPAAELAHQLAVWNVLTGTAGQIDGCTSRYTSEFPDRKGQASITVKVIEGGRVLEAKADTALPTSDRLIECLSSIGRLWRFTDGPFELTLPIVVQKGVKLRLKKPGEKDEPPPAAAAEQKGEGDDGFIRFTPGWTQQ